MNSMPNLLIGGTVMSGKTSYINTVVSCILLTKKPSEVKLVIYDSKKIDYSFYNGIPHLLAPVITNLETFNIALKNICYELENRIKKLKECNIKNISLYNEKIGNDEKYPDIILFVDDFSALNNFDEINNSIEFITSNGWYANIFVIAAANYPSSKVISTISKSNFPARMSFKVASSQASQIIINDVGAEKVKWIWECTIFFKIK